MGQNARHEVIMAGVGGKGGLLSGDILAESANLQKPLIVESTGGLPQKVERKDITVIEIPGVEKAVAAGDIRSANLVMLGAYIGATGAVSQKLIEKELEKRFGSSKKGLEVNKKAFREGIQLAQVAKAGG